MTRAVAVAHGNRHRCSDSNIITGHEEIMSNRFNIYTKIFSNYKMNIKVFN